MAHHYPGYGPGGPLAAFWRREITLRWLRVMVENLPPDSATGRAQAGHHWQHLDYAAQDTVDLLSMLITQFANAHRDPKKPPARLPEPSWRPGDPLPSQTEASTEERRARARATYDRITAQVLPGKG
ncbi:hypothetical protein [Streptomyces sp. B15]|uniref:hypothetical protein n=1 Tax=Streptomyces sp. B15 TaxID=1537797 RepID=UPI001B374859|nr:hypothetical protein [Streptomyces sp. B15]MBQ1122648.1 hypothetical protein [Streptomyces sp. B15]